MKNINKFFKGCMIGLIVISVAILVWGFTAGWQLGNDPMPATNTLLAWTYIMIAIAVLAVVIGLVMMAKTNPAKLLKIGIIFGSIAVVCLIGWVFASGADAVGYTGEPVSAGTLKLSDTILNATYITGVVAIAAIVSGVIRSAIVDKKK